MTQFTLLAGLIKILEVGMYLLGTYKVYYLKYKYEIKIEV